MTCPEWQIPWVRTLVQLCNCVPNPRAWLTSSTVPLEERGTPTLYVTPTHCHLSVQQIQQGKEPLDLSEKETEMLPGYRIEHTHWCEERRHWTTPLPLLLVLTVRPGQRLEALLIPTSPSSTPVSMATESWTYSLPIYMWPGTVFALVVGESGAIIHHPSLPQIGLGQMKPWQQAALHKNTRTCINNSFATGKIRIVYKALDPSWKRVLFPE